MSHWQHIENSTPALRNRAHQAVQRAIKDGRLCRPDACCKCGAHPGATVDGRPLIQAHHHDYSKPLAIEWLCASCHRKEHRLPFAVNGARKNRNLGTKNGRVKLTAQIAKTIRDSPLAHRKLAAMHGVCRTTVSEIKTGKIWAEAIREIEQQELHHDQQ